MIKTKAKVIRTDADLAYVEVEKKSACGGCEAKTTCGVSALGKFFGNKNSSLSFKKDNNLKTGDVVEIGLKEKDLIKGAFKTYLAPLIGFFIFALIGTFLKSRWSFASELLVVLFALAGMGLGFLFIKSRDKNPAFLLDKANSQTVKFDKEST